MKSYEKIKKNHSIIKQFVNKYKEELKIFTAVAVECNKMYKYEDYLKFLDELSDDEIVGNYLINLYNDDCIEQYELVLNGDVTFEDYVKMTCMFQPKIYKKYLKKIKERV